MIGFPGCVTFLILVFNQKEGPLRGPPAIIIFAYLEKLVNSPNLNFGAERLVGSSPTVSIQ